MKRHSRNGAKTNTPIASPVHHTDHAGQKPPTEISLDSDEGRRADRRTDRHAEQRAEEHERHDVADPIERLMEVDPLQQPRGRERRENVAAAVTAAAADVDIGRFTKNAAIATPGQHRRPYRRNATTAMPVGGHSGVTLCWIKASRRLKRAAT